MTILLFDLDDTLIEIEDSYFYFDNIIVDVFKKFNLTIPSSEERDLLWRNTEYKILLKSWNFPDHEKFWLTFDEIDFKGRRRLLQNGLINIFEDVKPYFQKIKSQENMLSIIITNTTQKIAEYILDYFNISEFFHKIYGLGDNQELCKPSPDGIISILSELSKNYNFKKSDVFIIGDSESDIIAGISAKINTVYLNRRKKKIELAPDFSMNTLNEFLQLLKMDLNEQN